MTTTPDIIVKNHPSREQLEVIYDLLDKCFSVGRDFFQERLDQDTAYDPDTTWFAEVNGEIASHVQIFPLYIRVGRAILKMGAIGSVGTDPHYRGLGLAHKILHAQTNYMKESDFDISLLLASKHAFYEKAGWRLIPQTALTIKKPASLERPSSCEVIPFEARYLDEIRLIYEQFNRNRTYTAVRNETYWRDLITWPEWKRADCLLLRRDEKILAYGIIEKKEAEQVFLNELLYLNEAEDGVEQLFHALCRLRPNARQILAMLQEDHKLYSYFQQHRATPIRINMAMWKMISLSSAFHKLQPELEDRLRGALTADQELHIALQCNEEIIYMDYQQHQLSISDTSKDDFDYTLLDVDERDLMTYIIFGYYEAAAERHVECAEHAGILQVLFPKQQAVFYLTDKF